jgi:hypothetical protein
MDDNKNQEEHPPQWINFVCPTCAVAYGINTLIKAIKKRRAKTT